MTHKCVQCGQEAHYHIMGAPTRYVCDKKVCHDILGAYKAHAKIALNGNMQQMMDSASGKPMVIIYTDEHIQLALEEVPYDERIPKEIHETQTQFIRAEKGTAMINLYDTMASTKPYKTYMIASDDKNYDDWVIIPADTCHEVVNAGPSEFRFYTIYSPRVH